MDGTARKTAIRAILLTAPGDRVMPASYGGGPVRSIFAPDISAAVAAA
jgi:phage baseplate assembly protein W